VQPALGDPASAVGVGPDDPQRSLPTPTILSFCMILYAASPLSHSQSSSQARRNKSYRDRLHPPTSENYTAKNPASKIQTSTLGTGVYRCTPVYQPVAF